jgi:hypothetical protein
MIKRYSIIIMLLLIGYGSKAQHVSPTQLLQMNGYWQMNDSLCIKLTHDYLMTIDKNWAPNKKEPLNDQKSFVISFGYSKDRRVWYQPGECELAISLNRVTNIKSLSYIFTESDTWDEYNKQMKLMSAIKIGSGVGDGGEQSIYTVNDIAFVLVKYPPGINGVNATYRVTLMPNKLK